MTKNILPTTINDEKFMRAALALARKAELQGEIPVGAVVVHQEKIVGEGFNQSIELNDPSAHAEMVAIRQAGRVIDNYRLADCTLYVTLEPCPMCAGLLVHSRINRLVFGSTDNKTGSAGSVFNLVDNDKLNHQIDVHRGILAEECSELLSGFFKQRRETRKLNKPKAIFRLTEFKLSHVKMLRSWFKTKTEIDKWAGPNFRYPHSIKSFGEDIRHNELASFVLLNKNNDMVAFGQFYQRLNRCHLGRLVVNPRFRGQGIATQLIEKLAQKGMENLGVNTLSLFVLTDNSTALNLYLKLGFAEAIYPETLPLENCLYLIKQ